jgi:serine phosphatase RsbU (regulator of sigma subunit)
VTAPHPTRALEEAGLARPSADESFDRIARLVQRHLGAPTALVSIVLPGIQVYPGAVGMPRPIQHTRRTAYSDSLCGEVVETGRPLVVEDLRDHPRLAHTSTATELGAAAYAGFPVYDRNGTAVGTVCALDSEPHAWSPTDLATLADLAAACTAELRLRLERQRAHSIQRVAVHATRRTRLLLDLTERFAGSTTLTETVEALRKAGTGIGTMWAGMALINESGTGLTLVEREGTYPHLPRQWRLDDDGIAAVTRALRPTFYRDGAALLRDLPWFSPWVDDAMGGMAFLPLVLDGQLLGLAALLWHGPRDHDAESRRTAGALAACVVQALTRIQVLEDRHRVATTLQTAMLTDLPAVPHLELASTYASATGTDQVGGDWYDAVVPDSGSCVLMIGDVTGHDMQAAARMGQLRSMLRTLVWCQDAAPAALVRELDRANRGLGVGASATALVARVDRHGTLDDGTCLLRWSSAGHPRPIVVRADGSIDELAGRSDLMLGIDPTTPRHDHEAALGPGDTLVLYTDGLVESRAVSYAVRTAELHRNLRELAGFPVADLPRELVDRMVHGQQRDDVAVLGARAR